MDFVIIGTVVLFALIGFLRGGARIFFGIFMLLIIMAASAFASAAICPLFLKSGKGESTKYTGAATVLMKPLGKALPSDGAFGALLDTEVMQSEDGELYVLTSVSGEDGYYFVPTKLQTAVEKDVPLVGSFVSSFVKDMARSGETLRTTFAYRLTLYIYETAVWIVLVVILAIIRNIIRKKIFRFLDNHRGPSVADRICGLVIVLAIWLALLWGTGVLIANFDDGENWAHSIDKFMTKGVIAKPLMVNNPLLKLINVKLPVVKGAAA